MLYSYSRLRCYEKCPRCYKFQYIDKVKVPEFESIEAFMGNKVHEVLDLFYNSVKKGEVLSLDYLFESYGTSWNNAINPSVVVNKQGKTHEDYRSIGEKCINDYYLRYKPFDSGEIVSTEMRIEADLSGDGRYRIMGYIDRLDKHKNGHYEIHDYKTSGRLPDTKQSDFDHQLALYELGVRQSFRHEGDVQLVWHYLSHDTEIRMQKNLKELDLLKTGTISKIKNVEKAVHENIFPVQRSALCS
jgi:putative RecB family exonuclease